MAPTPLPRSEAGTVDWWANGMPPLWQYFSRGEDNLDRWGWVLSEDEATADEVAAA
jgi:hypothetical protein